ncbi:hypothetical protein Mal4_02910 [Maioricimonas rarisocia]|uniref:Uncharacterized protein n=1 Tax=Maioricimonas rarisocia TaxID=2528026 RepID=A0A517Z0K1_9PLAN|nr:hypothetical protein [Maioricimonas rarisocia]QDU36008.1 hypothetical protein Mal4_02910 [Maioricimonas rarisocia]
MRQLLLFLTAGTLLCTESAAQEDVKLDVCDVAFLWPAPSTRDETEELLCIGDVLTRDGKPLVPQRTFDEILGHAENLRLQDPIDSEEIHIDLDDTQRDIASWRVAGIRIDPSAPGCSSRIRNDQGFGSKAQVRIIAQPVRVTGEIARALDVTMHIVFDYVTNASRPFEVDEPRFREIVDDLVAIKSQLSHHNVETTGARLGVHPGFAAQGVDMTDILRNFLKSHLDSTRLNAIAFMGLQQQVEPWLFFATLRNPDDGSFAPVSVHPSLPGSPGQALSFVTRSIVFPIPLNHQFGSAGVGTHSVFPPAGLDRSAIPDSTDPTIAALKVRDIPDIIANPESTHFFTADCVSCHTESSLRSSRLNGSLGQLAYKRPEGISPVDPAALPTRRWNVRNFGWGLESFRGNLRPTVSMRTANEAAESADFINTEYLADAVDDDGDVEEPDEDAQNDNGNGEHLAEEDRANPLTLIMTCRDEQAYNELQAKIKALLAREDNPINAALDSIGTVHFARFVFLDATHQVAVITSYDGAFDVYIHRFVDKIGDVFNLILDHVEGTEAMQGDDGKVSVQEHTDAFLEFVRKHDLKAVEPFYSAYPGLSVQQIRALQRMANE